MKIKNMKRNLVNAACIATAACTLAACGSSASSTTASSGATTTEASSAAETSEDTPLIGYSLNSMDSTMKTIAKAIPYGSTRTTTSKQTINRITSNRMIF